MVREHTTLQPILSEARRSRITGTHLYQLFRCERSVYLDWFGNPDLIEPPGESLELLLQRGRSFEDTVVEKLDYVEPEYDRGSFNQGAEQTLQFMRDGVVGISQGVVIDGDLLGIPDLLRREEGASDLGDFHYVVGDIKSSRRARADQVMQVVFYNEILTELQGRSADYGYLLLRDGHEERFRIADVRHRFLEALDEIRELLRNRAPRLRLRGECRKCRWTKLCHSEAEAHDDLSQLPGFSMALRVELDRLGVSSVRELRALSPERIGHVPGLARLHAGARAIADDRPVVLRRPAVPESAEHSFVQLTRDPFLDRTLVFGLLRADGSYQSFVVSQRDGEAGAEDDAQLEFLAELWRREGPIFHYGGAPVVHLIPAESASGPPVDHRLCDLRPVLRGAVVFPARDQDLASMASCFKGFEDIAGTPDGMACVWFDRYLETGEESWLQRVVEANERELRLLRTIHSWLVEIVDQP